MLQNSKKVFFIFLSLILFFLFKPDGLSAACTGSINYTCAQASCRWVAGQGEKGYYTCDKVSDSGQNTCGLSGGSCVATGVTKQGDCDISSDRQSCSDWNCRFGTVSCDGGGGPAPTSPPGGGGNPDLVITDFSIPAGDPGSTVTATGNIKNTGGTTINTDFSLGIQMDGSKPTDCGSYESGYEVYDASAKPIAPDSGKDFSIQITLPNKSPGTYTVWAKVDRKKPSGSGSSTYCAIDEESETNNYKYTTYTIRAPQTYPLTVYKSWNNTGGESCSSGSSCVNGQGDGPITSNPAGISCGFNCSKDYPDGTDVRLTADPNSSSCLVDWAGAYGGSATLGGCITSGSDTSGVITMNSQHSEAAIFRKLPVLNVSVSGQGRVTSSPTGINCTGTCSANFYPGNGSSSKTVTLTASPDAGYEFTGYSGACSGKSCSVSISLDESKSVTATFNSSPVACTPSTQNVDANKDANLSASGGTGSYSWSAPGGNPSSGNRQTFSTKYDTPGTKTVSVSSGTSSKPCTVNVGCPTTKPSGLSPSGTISSGTRNVTWNSVSGTTGYALRVDDQSNGWNNNCSNPNSGDVCRDDYAGTSYSYNFQQGHTYQIWVHAIYSCGWSEATLVNVSVPAQATLTPTAPVVPSLSCSVNGTTSLTFRWTPTADGLLEVDDKGELDNSTGAFKKTVFSGWTSTPKKVTGLKAGTRYFGHVSSTQNRPWYWSNVPSCTTSSVSLPNLVIDSIQTQPASSFNNADQVKIKVVVRNAGDLKTPRGFNVGFYKNQATQPSGRTIDERFSQASCPALDPDQTCSPVASFSPASSANCSNCFAAGFVDYNNQISEADETDNFASTLYIIGAGPTQPPATPTPPLVPAGPWIKLKDASFWGVPGLDNPIPSSIKKYDSDDTNERLFVITSEDNDPGAVVAYRQIDLGGANASSSNWQAEDERPLNSLFQSQTYNEYTRSRKEFVTITLINQVEENKIYILEGDLKIAQDDISRLRVNRVNAVLIVTGTVTLAIATEKFDPSGSVAILADKIKFFGDVGASTKYVREAKGIFVANTIETGETNQGLKVTGNLIAKQSLTNKRQWTGADVGKPSLFIIFDVKQYLDLLPYLSVAAYDWKQLQ